LSDLKRYKNIKKIVPLILLIFTLSVTEKLLAKEISCIPRAEMGETTSGDHIYERDDDLNIKNLSRIDFDKLTITSAEGNLSNIVKIGENIYKSVNGKYLYYFITNNEKTMVTELTMDTLATYVKVLLCK
jgi:hypothetical protein